MTICLKIKVSEKSKIKPESLCVPRMIASMYKWIHLDNYKREPRIVETVILMMALRVGKVFHVF